MTWNIFFWNLHIFLCIIANFCPWALFQCWEIVFWNFLNAASGKAFYRQVIKLPTSHGLNCHGRDSYETKIRNLSAITVTLNFFIFWQIFGTYSTRDSYENKNQELKHYNCHASKISKFWYENSSYKTWF